MIESRKQPTRKPVRAFTPPPRRRLIAIGKREEGRWKVRTSLWRYLVSTAISQ